MLEVFNLVDVVMVEVQILDVGHFLHLADMRYLLLLQRKQVQLIQRHLLLPFQSHALQQKALADGLRWELLHLFMLLDLLFFYSHFLDLLSDLFPHELLVSSCLGLLGQGQYFLHDFFLEDFWLSVLFGLGVDSDHDDDTLFWREAKFG